MNKLMFASVISEIQQSDIFMTVKARICEAPAANLNGARVTEAFIDEVVDNPDRYVGLPLYADVKALTSGNYRRLGHLYDSKTGEFHSTQIGSFYQFEKEEFEHETPDGVQKGCYLVGYVRIAKRNKKLSKAISELFADGALKFSFEVAVGEYEELDDDTILIDASESNYLEGTAIVTFPACEDAVALELVAQRKADDTEGGEEEMAETKIATETVEQPVIAETTDTAETKEETAEQQEEVAAVVVHDSHTESHATYAYDTESGVDVSQRVTIETNVSHVEEDAHIVEADDGIHIAEEQPEEAVKVAEETTQEESGESGAEAPAEEPVAEKDPVEETPEEEPKEEPAAVETVETPEPAAETPEEIPVAGTQPVEVSVTEEPVKKTAEQLIAELSEVVESLRQEIAELKETRQIAEVRPVTAEVNPLTADIKAEAKYTLLEKEERVSSYTLLSK